MGAPHDLLWKICFNGISQLAGKLPAGDKAFSLGVILPSWDASIHYDLSQLGVVIINKYSAGWQVKHAHIIQFYELAGRCAS